MRRAAAGMMWLLLVLGLVARVSVMTIPMMLRMSSTGPVGIGGEIVVVGSSKEGMNIFVNMLSIVVGLGC